MTPHDVLLAVRDRIKDEKNWCQGWRLKLDEQCCILGAIDMAAPYEELWHNTVNLLATRRNTPSTPDPYNEVNGTHEGKCAHINNTSTHAEVMAWIEDAISASVPAVDHT